MLSIPESYRLAKPLLSFEIFPPKQEADIAGLPALLQRITALRPGFVSVTCGAGGAVTGQENRTAAIAETLQKEHGVCAQAHLTCIAASRENLRHSLDNMASRGITHILALRGDLPEGITQPPEFHYAYELMEELRADGRFIVGGACYPEAHIDCDSLDDEVAHVLRKQEAGASYFITQLFFDNELFYRFREKALRAGLRVPVSAGIMPILGRSQIERMIFMCGASLPARVVKLLHRYEHNPKDLRRAGVEYAVEQALDLRKNGAEGLHLCIMNKAFVAEKCAKALAL